MWPFSSWEVGTLKFYNRGRGFGFVQTQGELDVHIGKAEGPRLDKAVVLAEGTKIKFKAAAKPTAGKKARHADEWKLA